MRAALAARPPRVLAVAVGWFALATSLAGCVIQGETTATVVGPAPDIRAYEDPSGTPDAPGPGGSVVEMVPALRQVALVDAEDRLVYVERPDDGSPGPDPYRVLTALLGPITPEEEAMGLSTAVPVGTWAQDAYHVDPTGAHVIVHLSTEFDAGGTDLEIERRIQQVACSLLVDADGADAGGRSGLELVELHIDGRGPEDARFVGQDEMARCP